MKRIFSLALLLSFWYVPTLPCRAQVRAKSCSEADVSAAWNSVKANTVTFTIPAGSCTWTSPLILTVPNGNTNLTVQGSSTISGNCATPPRFDTACTAMDGTTITDGCTNGCSPLWRIVTNKTASSKFRVTGLTIKGSAGAAFEYNGQLNIGGHSHNVRVDHNHFDTTAYESSLALHIDGWVEGVADHNVFDLGTSGKPGTSNGVHVDMGNYNNNSLGVGDGSWAAPTGFGTSDFFFIENNTLNYGYADDCGAGGKYVFRYNYLIGDGASQTHPTGGGGRFRGCRATEVYGNSFHAGSCLPNGCQTVMRLNGGAGLVWGNTVPTGYRSVIDFDSFRRDHTTYGQTATPAGWGYCGASFNGVGSNWDENRNASTGYHCFDQPGQGQGDLLVGGFTADGSGSNNIRNNATGCFSDQPCAWPRQALEPVYEWLDKWGPVFGGDNVIALGVGGSSSLRANTDYYNESQNQGAQSSPTSPFKGASGTGHGILANRPETCTPRVAYWATDQNALYQCMAVNTWNVYYRPYTFPHPLAQFGTSAQDASR